MKTPLKPYVLDFLKRQGYKYLLSRKIRSRDDSVSHITLIPIAMKPAILKPAIGFDSCFHIQGDIEEMELLLNQTRISVVLNDDDVLKLKKYLLRIFSAPVRHL